MPDRLPLETQTLYSELLDHLMAVQAHRSVGALGGSFTTKEIKGETYVYYQASLPGGATKQYYLGRKTAALDLTIQRFERERQELAPDLERVRRLAAQLRAGGAAMTDVPSGRVIKALADAGVFSVGGVLVGTHAFVVLGNMLGVRWASGSLRTQDVDVGAAGVDVDVAVQDEAADVPAALASLEMGFLPVPPLGHAQPSTPFKVRGQALRLDLLCAKRGSSDAPVLIRRLNAAAQPLDYLDLLLEAPERAPVLDGGASLVSVPPPARFALHKLVVATLRPAAMQAKARKDVAQAVELLSVLVEDRPGDLAQAWNAIERRGARWLKSARRGLAALKRQHPSLHARVAGLLT